MSGLPVEYILGKFKSSKGIRAGRDGACISHIY